MKIIALYRDLPSKATDAVLAEAMKDSSCRVARRSARAFNPSQAEPFDLALVDLSADKAELILESLSKWGVEAHGIDAEGETTDEGQQSESPFGSMTVAELRSYAKEKSIPLPGVINTRAEIIDYLTEKLAEAGTQ